MKNIGMIVFIGTLFFSVVVNPNKVFAGCSITNSSGSGIEQESIDRCLREQRRQDQIGRDQMNSDIEYAQGLYQIKLDYFYKLDSIEKQIDARNTSDSGYGLYSLSSVDCLMSMDIPSDPTTMDPNLFLLRIGNKEKCISYLNSYVKKVVPTQTVQPTKSNDQICSEKFGENWKWKSGTTCNCKDGYQISNNNCVPIVYNDPPVKTNDQICNDTYLNSKGVLDGNNRLSCDCKTGYNWNDGQTACVVVSETVKTSASGCTSTVGFSPTTGKSCSGLVASVTSVQTAQSSTTGVKFSRNLTVGSRGVDVTALQQILISGGFLEGDATGYFGQMTKVAVIKFQNEYAAEVLAPAGLTIGTGFVGASTRVILNTMGGSI